MVIVAHYKHMGFSSLLILTLLIVISGTTVVQAQTIKGIGKLEFGMKPNEVEALEGCSSQTQCLYDLMGKNRYFTLVYDGKISDHIMDSTPPPTATLTHIDINMGNHTREWFGELYEVLVAQYPVSHIPTEQEDLNFQNGTDKELIIGFAEGSVLLKIFRRQFGNTILHVVYQDKASAEVQRQSWEQSQPTSVPQ